MQEKNLALTIAALALEKQAQSIEIIDVSELADYADYIIVCGGRSERQVRAIAEEIQGGLKKHNLAPLGMEGVSDGHWVLMDFGSIVVHVFHENARNYYDIEGLWMDARRIPVEDPVALTPDDQGEERCVSGS